MRSPMRCILQGVLLGQIRNGSSVSYRLSPGNFSHKGGVRVLCARRVAQPVSVMHLAGCYRADTQMATARAA